MRGQGERLLAYLSNLLLSHCAGSEDGTVRVWEARSSQCIRIINAPDKAPVTGLIVLDRPAHLASGQGRHTRTGGADSGAHLASFHGTCQHNRNKKHLS